MSDEDAYMALVTSNAQSELTPLERGLHALGATEKGKKGKSVNAYAERVKRPQRSVQIEVEAARVAKVSACVLTSLDKLWRHLAEIHAAPQWLRPALVDRLIVDGWTVDAARKQAQRVAELKSPPAFADREAVAEALVAGRMRPGDVERMADIASRAKVDDEDLRAELGETLGATRPASVSDVQAIVGSIETKQAERDRAKREAEIASQRAAESAAARASKLRANCSLTEWKALGAAERQELLTPDGTATGFNKQENTAIEWAQYSWNPVTGCEHTCPYCYARDIAHDRKMEKAYPNGFEPTIRPRALAAPRSMKLPTEARTDTRYKNVFTCSMADLFGRWVPAEWINAVLSEVRAAPQWNFLFLTKFPKRMAEFDIPVNAWMGTTVDLQARVPAAEAAFARVSSGVRWLSIEPMLEPLRFSRLDLFQWIVIGGASRSSKTPEWKPPYAWIHDLVQQAREAGVKVYFKTNLLGSPTRILELPFDAPITPEKAELPAVFRYLGREAGAA
jgi:protein gp37